MDVKSYALGYNAGASQKGGNVSQAELEAAIKAVVPGWALEEELPKAADVGADPAGTAESKTSALRDEVNGKLEDYDKSTAVNKKIGDHNVSTESHADLRLELQRLADRLNAALNSTDTSLDDLKEIVAYIKSNKTLIDGITSSKVNVTDIVNNLTTNASNVPLSAAQGVVLKLLIDSLEEIVEGKTTAEQVAAQISTALSDHPTTADMGTAISNATKNLAPMSAIPTVPTKVSQLTNDSGYLTPTTGDQRYPAKQATETALAEHGGKIAQLEEALANSMVEFAESVEWLEANGDKDRTYYLPDGYEYKYSNKYVEIPHNANTGDGDYVNNAPSGTWGNTAAGTLNGFWVSPVIPIDPTKMAPVGNPTQSRVTISGINKVVPVYSNRSVAVWYYKSNGQQIMMKAGTDFASISTNGEISTPFSFNLKDTNTWADSNWATVGGVRIGLGISTSAITEEDIKNLVVNIPFLDFKGYREGWYSTGKLHSDDPAVQENAKNITNLQKRMDAAEAKLGGVGSEPLFAKLGLIGDSLTNQEYQGWQAITVSMLGNPAWHKNAITGSSVANYGDGREANYTPFVDRYLNTPADCDCIVIMGGTNDATYQYSYDMGTVGVLANNTFKGAYSTIIEGLLNRNPATRLMLMVPPRFYNVSDNSLNANIEKYAEAVREIAKHYALPCLDLFDLLGQNKCTAEWGSWDWANNDPIHFSNAIAPRVGRMVANFIRQYY